MSNKIKVRLYSVSILFFTLAAYALYNDYKSATQLPEPVVEETEKSEKQTISGHHIEWTVPEGKSKIYIRYKTPDGNTKFNYNFSVNVGEKFEIIAVGE